MTNSTKAVPYVYLLVHKVTGQFYIGSRRANTLPSHLDLPVYRTSSNKIHAIGFNNFDWYILVECFGPNADDDAYDIENAMIAESIRNELIINGHYTHEGSRRFKRSGPHTEEAKEKMVVAQRSNRKELTPEQRKARSERMTGRKFSDETKEKMAAAKRGKVFSQETRDKMKAHHERRRLDKQ